MTPCFFTKFISGFFITLRYPFSVIIIKINDFASFSPSMNLS